MKTTKIKTAHEIIDEIAGHYNLGNRSLGDGKCVYNGPNNTHCAFAYMVMPERLHELASFDMKENYANCSSHSVLKELGQEILKPEFRGQRVEFYRNIQSLHDEPQNWDSTGLSEEGKEAVIRLKEKWPNT